MADSMPNRLDCEVLVKPPSLKLDINPEQPAIPIAM
jgi:hypothetical protein